MKNCKKCNSKVTFGESWLDHNGDYRNAQYYFCSNCKTLFNILGDEVFQVNAPKNIQLTFKFD